MGIKNNTNNNDLGGHFLCSGHLKNFNAVGELGQSVYQIAFALREAIRRSNNKDSLECFLAIPQENNTSHTVDWYADERLNTTDASNTSVINWNQATTEEQETARQKLLDFEKKIKALSIKLLEKTQDTKGDLYTFAKLLPKTIVTPSQLKEVTQDSQSAYLIDPSYIYLVGAEQHPVLAFWGFSNPDGAVNDDPFHFLHTPLAASTPLSEPVTPVAESEPLPPPVPPVIAPVTTSKNWWSWLRWLLLALLLLLLLLFAWRSCSKPTLPTATTSGLSTPNLSMPSLPKVDLGSDGAVSGRLWGFNLPSWFPKFGLGANTNINSPAISAATPAINGSALNSPTNTDLAGEGINAAIDSPSVPPMPIPTDAEAVPAQGMSPVVPGSSSPSAPSLSTSSTSQAQLGPELQIPPQLVNQTMPSYIDGEWQVHAIQDQKTGRPMRLEYSIQDGEGLVRIHQGNGVSCLGSVQAMGKSSGLHIDSTNQATCDDGSSYEMPQVECYLNARQETECFGRYGDQKFPISMRHAVK